MNQSKNGTRNRRPKNFRKSKIIQEIKDLMLKIRLDNLTYSKNKIEIILIRDYDTKLTHRTIGKILKEFNKRSLISINIVLK